MNDIIFTTVANVRDVLILQKAVHFTINTRWESYMSYHIHSFYLSVLDVYLYDSFV